MVRDTTEGKIDYLNVRFGPMLKRWAAHLTKGRAKYPDPEPGVPNWMLAQGMDEYTRARISAARHFEQWLAGDRDEDHASAVYFNINVAEYVLEKMDGPAVLGTYTRANTEEGEEMCDDRGPEGWYCERPVGHAGSHWFPHEDYDSDATPTWG